MCERERERERERARERCNDIDSLCLCICLSVCLPEYVYVCVFAGKAERRVPRDLTCPISHTLMRNPVVAADGFTYEKAEIEKWFEHSRCVC